MNTVSFITISYQYLGAKVTLYFDALRTNNYHWAQPRHVCLVCWPIPGILNPRYLTQGMCIGHHASCKPYKQPAEHIWSKITVIIQTFISNPLSTLGYIENIYLNIQTLRIGIGVPHTVLIHNWLVALSIMYILPEDGWILWGQNTVRTLCRRLLRLIFVNESVTIIREIRKTDDKPFPEPVMTKFINIYMRQ